VSVAANDEEEVAGAAFGEWLRHVEAGKIWVSTTERREEQGRNFCI
jgi:hypothetical protein